MLNHFYCQMFSFATASDSAFWAIEARMAVWVDFYRPFSEQHAQGIYFMSAS